MATAAFYDWVKAGRHWFPATPVTQYRTLLHIAGWPWETLGTIGDEAHLQAETPQDHCPFSVTGWPNPNPYPFVLALDVGHDPGNGRDVNPLVEFWIGSARIGDTPWVKYIVWRGMRWDVRNDWEPVPADGHYDHAHISFRTDYYQASIDGWNPLGGNDMGLSDTERILFNSLCARGEAEQNMSETIGWKGGNPGDVGQPMRNVAVWNDIHRAVGELLDRPPVSVDPQALADALAGNPRFIDNVANTIVGKLGGVLTKNAMADALQSAAEVVRG